jgi:hypothetical protein
MNLNDDPYHSTELRDTLRMPEIAVGRLAD